MRVEPEITSGPDFRHDGSFRRFGKWSAVIAGNPGRPGATRAGVGNGRHHVRGASGGGKPDDDVFTGGATAGDVALAQLFGVFVDLDRGSQGLGAAGHDVRDLPGSGGVGRGTLGGVEGCDAAAGSGANVDQPSAVTEAAGYLVDDLRDLRECLLNGCRDLGVFVVDDAGDL